MVSDRLKPPCKRLQWFEQLPHSGFSNNQRPIKAAKIAGVDV
jgi:hypothetical protein